MSLHIDPLRKLEPRGTGEPYLVFPLGQWFRIHYSVNSVVALQTTGTVNNEKRLNYFCS